MPGGRGIHELDEKGNQSPLEVGGGKTSPVLSQLTRLYEKTRHDDGHDPGLDEEDD